MNITREHTEAAVAMEKLDLTENSIQDTMEAIVSELTAKAHIVASCVRNIEAEVKSLEAEENLLSDNRLSLKRTEDWLRAYILDAMQRANTKRIKATPLTLAIISDPPSVIIDNQAQIPDRFIHQVTTVSVDRIALIEELKSGVLIPGAHLEIKERLEIK